MLLCARAQLLDVTDSAHLDILQRRILDTGCLGTPHASFERWSGLQSVLSTVLRSADCHRLLRRLSSLQAHCDRFDVEAVRVVHRRLQQQHGPTLDEALWSDTADGWEQLLHRIPSLGSHTQQQQQQQEHDRAPDSASLLCARHSARHTPALAPSASSDSVDEWADRQSSADSRHVVRDYLLAHTLKDCSLLLDIAALDEDARSACLDAQDGALPLYSWQGDGAARGGGVYSMQVIDLDRKRAINIPRYAQLDTDIATHYVDAHATADNT